MPRVGGCNGGDAHRPRPGANHIGRCRLQRIAQERKVPEVSARITRRSFLKAAGTGALALLAAGCAPAVAPQPTAPPAATQAVATAIPATQAPAAKKVVTFASYSFSTFEETIKKILAKWQTKYPNVEVHTEFASWGDFWPKVQTEVAGGTPPDVSLSDGARQIEWSAGGILLPLTEYINKDNYPLDQYPASCLAWVKWAKGSFQLGTEGGEIWGLPGDAQPWDLYYNKTMFDKAGVSYPTDDWTWNDFLSAAKTMTKAPDQFGCYAPMGCLGRCNLVYSAGGSALSDDQKKSALDSAPTTEAFKWVWDLIYTHKVAPQPVPSEATDPFASGRVAMIIDGVWRIQDLAPITDFVWDMALQPKHPKTGKFTTSAESDCYWAYKGSKNPDMAWNLLKWLASVEGETELAAVDFVVPPSITAVAQQWYSRKPPEHRVKALDNIVKDSRISAEIYYQCATVEGAYFPVLDPAWYEGKDIVTQLKEAANVMNEELAKAWDKFSKL